MYIYTYRFVYNMKDTYAKAFLETKTSQHEHSINQKHRISNFDINKGNNFISLHFALSLYSSSILHDNPPPPPPPPSVFQYKTNNSSHILVHYHNQYLSSRNILMNQVVTIS